jgi:hypothetical protein
MTDQEIKAGLLLIRRTAAELATAIHHRSFDYGSKPAIAARVELIQAQAAEALRCHIPQLEGELTADDCRRAIETARQEFDDTNTTEAWDRLDRTKAMARHRYPDEFP